MALEARRYHAATLLEDGSLTNAEIADLLGVSCSSVDRWAHDYKLGGLAALSAKPQPGAKCKLSDQQKMELKKKLIRGPLANGYATLLWTCKRVADLVKKEFGVTYNPDHLGRILHDLGFSLQRPRKVDPRRDEAAIKAWRDKEWLRIKKRDAVAKLA